MKKTLSIVLSAILATLMVASSLLVGATDATQSNRGTIKVVGNLETGNYSADTAGKTDVLANHLCVFTSSAYPDGISDERDAPKLTDGVYAIDPLFYDSTNAKSYAYFNKKWAADATTAETIDSGTESHFEYKLTDGTTASFIYTWEWAELDVDVDSFRIWANNENKHLSYDTDDTFEWRQEDSEFCILISQDGGKTYSVAFKSIPFEKGTVMEGETEKTVVTSTSANTKLAGGDWDLYDAIDQDNFWVYRYATCGGDFAQEYKGVTNIVYGAVHGRRNGNTSTVAQHYTARISEIDLYGTTRTPAAVSTEEVTTATPTTEAPKTEAPVVTTEAPKTTTEAPKTEAPVVTTSAPAATEAPKTEKGCGGSIAFAGVAVVMTLGCAIIRKKH